MVLLIIAAVLLVASFGYLIFRLVRAVKVHIPGQSVPSLDKKTLTTDIALAGAAALSNIGLMYGIVLANNWTLTWYEHIFLIFGAFLFVLGLATLVYTFTTYYYRPTLEPKQRKWVRIAMFIAIPVTIIFFCLAGQSIGDHMTYPLISGIDFTSGFFTPASGGGGFKIAWYGILVVGGALVTYSICDHHFYKKYGKHGILDSTFIVAFPAGIIGARLWYCFVLEPETYLSDPVKILRIADGGLAIQGGAMMGILVGVIWFMTFRKYCSIRFAIDAIVPTILIAQAIGRWGNFFNCEVHGIAVSMDAWRFLPNWLINNMQYSTTAPSLIGTNQMYVPLFLIESVINIGGYFLIMYLPTLIDKWLPLGSRAGLYLSWYGLVRLLLEPLRYGYQSDASGYGYSQSFITAIVMIALGLVLIGVFFLLDKIKEKKGKKVEHFNYE